MRRAVAGLFLLVACSSAYGSAGTVDDGGPANDGGADGSDLDGGTIEGGLSAPGCPSERGSAMVRVTVDDWDYCIDATEATVGQYQAFLDSVPSLADAGPECEKSSSFKSDAPMTNPALAVESVSWCDARAFCAWAGKRLCGGKGGAHVGVAELTKFQSSEWMAACTRYGTRAAPYGPALDPARCNVGSDAGAAAAPGTSDCPGGFDGMVDMIGNVTEWENNCTLADGAAVYQCQTRGSYYRMPATWGRCEQLIGTGATAKSTGAGIRCCADPR